MALAMPVLYFVRLALTKTGPRLYHNDYMMAKRRKALRRAALRLGKTAWQFCHIFIAMSIAQMIQGSFAAKRVVWQRKQSIVFAMR